MHWWAIGQINLFVEFSSMAVTEQNNWLQWLKYRAGMPEAQRQRAIDPMKPTRETLLRDAVFAEDSDGLGSAEQTWINLFGLERSPYHLQYRSGHVIPFVARGDNVLAPAPGGGYAVMTGTNFAKPTIVGLCALLLSAYPRMEQFEVKAILKTCAMQARL